MFTLRNQDVHTRICCKIKVMLSLNIREHHGDEWTVNEEIKVKWT